MSPCELSLNKTEISVSYAVVIFHLGIEVALILLLAIGAGLCIYFVQSHISEMLAFSSNTTTIRNRE